MPSLSSRATGSLVSTAIRRALVDAAQAEVHRQLREESARVAADPADRAEAAQILKDMETLGAW